jgi:hypothetical protein
MSTCREAIALDMMLGLKQVRHGSNAGASSWMHVYEVRRLALLLQQAEPLWLLLVAAFQVGTCICAWVIAGVANAVDWLPAP